MIRMRCIRRLGLVNKPGLLIVAGGDGFIAVTTGLVFKLVTHAVKVSDG